MLQKVRNEQTMRILERLRRQGAPSSTATPLMGVDEEEDEEQPGPDDEGQSPGLEGPGTSVADTSMPGSPALAEAKKRLKRRY